MFMVGACLTRQLPIDNESEVLDRQRAAVDTRLFPGVVLEGVPGHPPVAFAFRLHAVPPITRTFDRVYGFSGTPSNAASSALRIGYIAVRPVPRRTRMYPQLASQASTLDRPVSTSKGLPCRLAS